MGGFFAFFGTTLGKLVLDVGVTAALDVASALTSGGPQYGQKLKNKSYRSDAYDSPWMRQRGTTRAQGKIIWGTNLVETTHKTVSGGIFGLGSTSTYYYTYSVSLAVGFGKKLGGGAAAKFLRIFIDGKILYNAIVTDATVTGSVTVADSAGSGELVSAALWPEGANSIPVVTGPNSALVLNAGDVFSFRWYDGSGNAQPLGTTYTVQANVNLGPNQTGSIPLFPPLGPDPRSPDTNHSVIQIAVPGLNAPLFDQSSFDPDPHDGSHLDSTPVGPGGIRFYLGSDTQNPDPLMVQKLGAGNVPGYRGTCYALIFNLQLQNYGNHIGAVSAEIAWDDSTGKFPAFGPVALGVATPFTTIFGDYLILAGDYYPNPAALAPTPPVIVGIKTGGGAGSTSDAYVVNTQSNALLVSGTIPSVQYPFFGAVAADATCIFMVNQLSALQWAFTKIKLSDLSTVESLVDRTIFEPAVNGLKLYDTFASLLGSPVLKQMAVYSGKFGSITLIDREKMIVAAHAETVDEGLGAANPLVAVDPSGDIWVMQNRTLVRYDGQFSTTVAINPITLSPEVVLAYPDLSVEATYDLSASMPDGLPASAFFYDPATNNFLIVQNNRVLRVDLNGNVLGVSALSSDGSSISPMPDLMGTVLLGSGNTSQRINIADVGGTLSPVSYDYTDWLATLVADGMSVAAYDPASNSVWLTDGGKLYRIYLDRAAGNGVTEDVIAAALMAEAGYDPSQYHVSAFSGFSVQGVEYEQQPYKQSLATLMQAELVDGTEIDGQIKFATRSRAPVLTIPEDDLGASEGTTQEPRLTESLQEETEVPLSVWFAYYDPLKDYQIARQYQKRISQPYASDLLSNPKVVHSRTQEVISLPITDNATPMKQRADKRLFDHWAARNKYSFKTGIKYIRLDPTDPIAITYKGSTLLMRLLEADRGAQFALAFQAESYDQNVYSNPALFSDSGIGSGEPPTAPPIPPTVTPTPPPTPVTVVLLGSASDDVVDITAPSGAESGWTLPHSLGYTPSFAIISGFSGGNIWFDGTRYDGTNLYLKGSASGVKAKAYIFKTAPSLEISLAPTAEGNFQVGQSLAAVPGMVLVQMTSGGNIWSQPQIADSALAYFTASDAGVTAKAGLWLQLTGSGSPSVNKKQIPLTATADGNFQVAHGLGVVPKNVFIHMNAPGFPAFWFQDGVSGAADGYDAVNIYLVSPGAGVSGVAEVLY